MSHLPSRVEVALLGALGRLDQRLRKAEVQAKTLYGASAGADPFRGLHISAEDVDRLLARAPGLPLFGSEHGDPAIGGLGASARDSRLAEIVQMFGLEPFDFELFVLAVAPEIDLRYERIYAFLQDDITRRRPTVDLALHLFCEDPAARLLRRSHFATTSPLFRHGLLRLEAEAAHPELPLLAHALVPDPLIISFLFGEGALDRRLVAIATLTPPSFAHEPAPLPRSLIGLEVLVEQALVGGPPVRVLLEGEPATERLRAARLLAHSAGLPLLRVDLAQAPTPAGGHFGALKLASLQARLQGWALFVDCGDLGPGDLQKHGLGDLEPELPAAFLLGMVRSLGGDFGTPLGCVHVRLGPPDVYERRALWRAGLAEAGRSCDEATLDALASRFILSARQIAEAAAAAGAASRWRDALGSVGEPAVRPAADDALDLYAFARAECGHELGRLAIKVEPRQRWEDLVLGDDALAQLREICQRVRLREDVLGSWGFGEKLSNGKGTSALFSGGSGTGKTMAAEVIANELGIDLFKIELATVVSKYIGETEKNLERVFAAAESQNAILLFDEADSIFGKRSEVSDAHDRYANLEVSFLLQKMEAYEGMVILATNLRQNIDDAFLRRFAFVVPFPFPDAPSRRRIWARAFPTRVPLAEDLPFDRLAERLALSGGNIRNIALASAFLARESGGPVRFTHLVQAIGREYQKMGRRLSPEELGALSA